MLRTSPVNPANSVSKEVPLSAAISGLSRNLYLSFASIVPIGIYAQSYLPALIYLLSSLLKTFPRRISASFHSWRGCPMQILQAPNVGNGERGYKSCEIAAGIERAKNEGSAVGENPTVAGGGGCG